ncbi:MAG: SEC-C metal-binding domain-containing protein [Mariprofundus sp.]
MVYEQEGESLDDFLKFKCMLDETIAILVQVEPDVETFIESFVQYVDDHGDDDFIRNWGASYGIKMHKAAHRLAVHIWNHTPLPSRQYQTSPVLLPKRNERCFCGSGKKFKACCGRLAHALPPVTEIFLLEMVLRSVSKSELSRVWRVIPHSTLGSIAFSADPEDRTGAERYLLMLDPIFKQDDSCLDECSAGALRALIHLCVILEKPRKRTTLINRMKQHPNEKLRTVALHELCVILTKQGDFEAAYKCLPDLMALSENSLEVIDLRLNLLHAENRVEEMILGATHTAVIIESLEQTGEALDDFKLALDNRISKALADLEQIDFNIPSEDRLLKWLQSAVANPPPLLHSVNVHDGYAHIHNENPFSYDVEENLFQILYDNDQLWHKPDRWSFIFDLHPELAGNLNVLSFLQLALFCANNLKQKQELIGLVHAITKTQLQRLLPNDIGIAMNWKNNAGEKILEVLEALARYRGQEGYFDEAIEIYQWVLRLNPEDEHGIRAILLAVFLLAERNSDAAALCDTFKNDTNIHMRFGHVLALFRLGELEKAGQLLSDATELFPDTPYALLRNSFKRPKMMNHEADAYRDINSLNKVEQAWCYQSKSRGLWQRTPGAIAWLKKSCTSRKRPKNRTRI